MPNTAATAPRAPSRRRLARRRVATTTSTTAEFRSRQAASSAWTVLSPASRGRFIYFEFLYTGHFTTRLHIGHLKNIGRCQFLYYCHFHYSIRPAASIRRELQTTPCHIGFLAICHDFGLFRTKFNIKESFPRRHFTTLSAPSSYYI